MRHHIFFLAILLACAPQAAMAQENLRVSKRDGMPQVLIPAGEFLMGADDDDAFGRKIEFPPHRIYLDAYWIDQHEVTNAQYVQFLNSAAKGDLKMIYGHCDIGNPVSRIAYDPATGLCTVKKGSENDPVTAVSWYGADAYARFLRRRLPTEAEWERAARGDDGRRYPWGNEWRAKNTNTREAGRGRPAPVGSMQRDRSPFGVWDLAGNAREWVQDAWDEEYYLTSPSRNPVCEGDRSHGVVRGGAWCLTEWDARVTSRQPLVGGAQRRYMGFRCAETVPEPLPPAMEVGQDVLFYAPMDGVLYAAAAKGERRPLKAPKNVSYVPGRRGQAALLGADQRGRYWADYDTEGNIKLDEGTVSMWVQPHGWKGTDPGFRFFFMLKEPGLCYFYIYRFVKDNFLLLAGNGVEGEWGSIGMTTEKWQDGQWIHLAAAWKGRTFALYVDGKEIGRTEVPPEKHFRGMAPVFSLGQSQDWDHSAHVAQTAIDEFVIFSRALGPDEIAKERDRTGGP